MSNRYYPVFIKHVIIVFVCLFYVQGVYAQVTKTVSGTVTNEENKPLSGVTVALKSATGGVFTDKDGKFSIVAAVGNTL